MKVDDVNHRSKKLQSSKMCDVRSGTEEGLHLKRKSIFYSY